MFSFSVITETLGIWNNALNVPPLSLSLSPSFYYSTYFNIESKSYFFWKKKILPIGITHTQKKYPNKKKQNNCQKAFCFSYPKKNQLLLKISVFIQFSTKNEEEKNPNLFSSFSQQPNNPIIPTQISKINSKPKNNAEIITRIEQIHQLKTKKKNIRIIKNYLKCRFFFLDSEMYMCFSYKALMKSLRSSFPFSWKWNKLTRERVSSFPLLYKNNNLIKLN